jgi:hypothetical protein
MLTRRQSGDYIHQLHRKALKVTDGCSRNFLGKKRNGRGDRI